jgi:formate dehydrogenase subunit delta
MSPDKLIYMANQIGRSFAYQPHEQAVASTTDHLLKFWDPRMRKIIKEQIAQPHSGLDEMVREAVAKLPS